MNKQNSIWHFGFGAGIDFNSSSPTVISSPQIKTSEGCASICDETSGQLIFYTDGTDIWDKNHNHINPTNPLKGNSSSTSSAVIVPMAINTSLYYIFTVDYRGGNNGLHYSIVDASNQASPILTSTVNVQLTTPTSEKCWPVA